jgi:hypothetical protein
LSNSPTPFANPVPGRTTNGCAARSRRGRETPARPPEHGADALPSVPLPSRTARRSSM